MATTRNLTMGDLMSRFRCEDACREYLEALRWPDGVSCPRCGSSAVYDVKGRAKYQCGEKDCRYHFSVMAGTKLHDSKLPLWKWFLAVFLMIHAKKGISAKQLHRMIGGSYKTSWFLCHRIRAAMKDVDSEKLTGVVEVDETFVGGEAPQAKKNDNKSVVMAAVQRDTGKVRFQIVPNRRKKHLQDFFDEYIDPSAEAVYTDKLKGYRTIDIGNAEHKSVRHSKLYNHDSGKMETEWVNGQVHTNTVEGVFSLLKRAIIGSYHKVGEQHLQSYLDEVSFKYNNRKNPYLFRETLKALIGTETLPYCELVGHSENPSAANRNQLG